MPPTRKPTRLFHNTKPPRHGAPCGRGRHRQMYAHILIATDGSQLAEKAVLAGLSLAKDFGAKATAVTVSEPWAMARTCHGSRVVPFDAYETASAEVASKSLASVCDLAKQLEVECATVHVKDQPA